MRGGSAVEIPILQAVAETGPVRKGDSAGARELLNTARLMEELQFSLNEGACIEAATTGVPVFVDDVAHDAHAVRAFEIGANWGCGEAAEQVGVRPLDAVPLLDGRFLAAHGSELYSRAARF